MEFKRRIKIYLSLFISLFLIYSCGTESIEKDNNTQELNNIVSFNGKQITSPQNGAEFTIGDTIKVNSEDRDSLELDSVAIIVDGKKNGIYASKENNFLFQTSEFHTGKHIISVESYSKGKSDRTSVNIFFKSDIIPKEYKAKIIKTYPHNVKSYTQGLTFDNGNLYEGTGQWGESSLKLIDLETGKTKDEFLLPEKVFGEGIVVVDNDEIIQLTWQSRKAFVINKKDLSLIKTFIYDTEGWGITNYNDNLIMSDGSHKLYVVEPNTFTIIKQIEVFDNQKAIKNLNELEIIDGKIYANIYLSHKIVVINPTTGKVLSNIDLTSIIPEKYFKENDNVLNGIAFNPENNKLYITGKRWDKLFEIELIEK
jgi:glutamine cyclotransferase